MRGRTLIVAGMLLMMIVSMVCEGQLTPPAPPNDANSAKFTLGDIWNRLSTGAAGTKRGATFANPVAGPGTATMKTTDEIMAVAPAADNTNGASPADVAAGRTFWGLRTSGGTWGLTTGAATPARVEKTGQFQCYDASYAPTPCPGYDPGQDGALKKGAAWPNPRFTDNANGTVTDNLTGLIWLKNAHCFVDVFWRNAMQYANFLANGQCSLTDGSTAGQWRLPNVKELQSLIHYGYSLPALPNQAGTGQHNDGDAGRAFDNVASEGYWSSSMDVRFPGHPWYVNLATGLVASDSAIVYSYHVWPVRGGQ